MDQEQIKTMRTLHPLQIEPIIRKALEEDWGHGDWTSDLCVPAHIQARAHIYSKSNTVVAGVDVAQGVFSFVDPKITVSILKDNSSEAEPNDIILSLEGPARSILKAERVALNFLGRMCGIAKKTREFVTELKDFPCQLLDTRKTTPGLRLLEKTATAIGGARNHRLCLTDGVLVKENHIRAAGSISLALSRLLESLPPTLKIEVETTNLKEVQEAIDAGADLIMLDNMSLSEMAMAVRTARGRVLLEASGNVTLSRLKDIAATGVDFISTGAIIHSAPWADLSLLFEPKETP
jgi:nicotinate-nucleotide pyrophosphorylase (carboxylating)